MPIGFFLNIFRHSGSFLKKNHEYVLVALGVCLLLWVLNRNENSWASKFKQVNEMHAHELQQIDELRKKEQKEYEQNLKTLQDQLHSSQELYDQQKIDLSNRKKTRITKIVTDDGDDPVKLANDLSRVTGFKVKQ